MSNSSAIERVAIIGTAPTWKECPWDDPGLHIASLNDAYSLGVPRADAWFDLHPTDRMWFRPKDKHVFKEGDIPPGVYVRPEGHLEWLKEKARTMPVWLQSAPPAEWPVNAQRFPIERLMEFMRARPDQEAFIASSPAMIVAHYVLQGAKQIQIYGIHLSTQGEYVRQLPNFSWLLGKIEAMGVDVVIPKSCPLLKHSHVYAYEPEPVNPDLAARKRFAEAERQYAALASTLISWPRWKSKGKELTELRRLQAIMADAKQAAHHARVLAGAA